MEEVSDSYNDQMKNEISAWMTAARGLFFSSGENRRGIRLKSSHLAVNIYTIVSYCWSKWEI